MSKAVLKRVCEVVDPQIGLDFIQIGLLMSCCPVVYERIEIRIERTVMFGYWMGACLMVTFVALKSKQTYSKIDRFVDYG